MYLISVGKTEYLTSYFQKQIPEKYQFYRSYIYYFEISRSAGKIETNKKKRSKKTYRITDCVALITGDRQFEFVQVKRHRFFSEFRLFFFFFE